MIRKRIYIRYGVLFGRGAEFDNSLSITHPTSIIIGPGAVIKENVTIYQGVTLGLRNAELWGDAKKVSGKGFFPTLEKNAIIYSNSIVLGNVTVGEGAVVGANSVVTRDVPPYTLVAGAPAKVVKKLKLK